MNDITSWLEAHDKLSGWVQFAGAMLALGVTYLFVRALRRPALSNV